VAAMANEGGILIYGVGEDANKRATLLRPIVLKGVPEQVIRSCRRASRSVSRYTSSVGLPEYKEKTRARGRGSSSTCG
jgi:hypothetical protein